MKLCEFFKKQFDDAKETAKHFEADSKYLVEVSGYGEGSFEWFKELSKRYLDFQKFISKYIFQKSKR